MLQQYPPDRVFLEYFVPFFVSAWQVEAGVFPTPLPYVVLDFFGLPPAHTPHVPPLLLYLQPLQFFQAVQYALLVHRPTVFFFFCTTASILNCGVAKPMMRISRRANSNFLILFFYECALHSYSFFFCFRNEFNTTFATDFLFCSASSGERLS